MASKAQSLIIFPSGRLLALLLAGQLFIPTASYGDPYATEVYDDGYVRISAGFSENGASILQFGDVVEMGVSVEFDQSLIELKQPDEQFFESAWAASSGVVLKDYEVTLGRSRLEGTQIMRALYQFQVLSCPNEEATCPGTRSYFVPEFSLQYSPVERRQPDEQPITVSFRLWPESLTVLTSIVRDDEGQLLPFQSYFPNGGYPEPLSVIDSSGVWWITAGTALTIFAGGIFMWPFGNRQKNEMTTESRWQLLLQQIESDDDQNEAQLIENIRRCLVWYCNDSLRIDPFAWLDLAETAGESSIDSDHSDLRSLFVLLLHNPVGRGKELKMKLKELTEAAAVA